MDKRTVLETLKSMLDDPKCTNEALEASLRAVVTSDNFQALFADSDVRSVLLAVEERLDGPLPWEV